MEEKCHRRRKVSSFLSHQDEPPIQNNSMRGSEIDALSVLSYQVWSLWLYAAYTNQRGVNSTSISCCRPWRACPGWEGEDSPLFFFTVCSNIWHKVWMNWTTYHHRRLQTARFLICRRNIISYSECWSRIFFVPLYLRKQGRNPADAQGRHNLKSNLRKSGQDSESGWRDWCSLFVFVSYRCKPLCGTHTPDMK